jgi:hypothetical protein
MIPLHSSPTGFGGSIIHVFNKNESVVKETKFYQEVKNRRNVILLGDSLGDVTMATDKNHDTVLRIGKPCDSSITSCFLEFIVSANQRNNHVT